MNLTQKCFYPFSKHCLPRCKVGKTTGHLQNQILIFTLWCPHLRMGREDVLNTVFSQNHISYRQAEAAEGEPQVGAHHLESCGERIAVSPCSSMDAKNFSERGFCAWMWFLKARVLS